MPHLFMDCRFGIGGDMFLAALAGLGLDLEPLAWALGNAGVEVELAAPVVRVRGLAGRRLNIGGAGGAQPLRHLDDILAIVERLALPEIVRTKSAAAFRTLAEVEARMHGIGLQDVHFHEVGAVDTLVDVCGAFWGLDDLGVSHVVCSPLPWFSGTVDCAHGRLPLPAPAALELLKGKPVFPTDFEMEIITPTGALLVDQLVDAFAKGPQGTILDTATSYGTHDLPESGGLRLVLFKPGKAD